MFIDPTNNRTEGYHLFLQPTGDIAAELQRIITTLAREYNGPVFVPHITIAARIPAKIGEEDIRAKTSELARTYSSFAVTLEDVGMENVFFRALYMKVQKTHELETLHIRANKAFSLSDAEAYVPHVSLLYCNFSAEEKELVPTFALLKGISFLVDRVYLYRTEGEATEWQKVEEFPFQGK